MGDKALDRGGKEHSYKIVGLREAPGTLQPSFDRGDKPKTWFQRTICSGKNRLRGGAKKGGRVQRPRQKLH